MGLFIDKRFAYQVQLKDTVHEWLIVKIMYPFEAIICVTYHRDKKFSKSQYCEWLELELTRLRANKGNVFVCGDFNIDLLVPTIHSTELQDIMRSNNLELRSPLEVTRAQGNSKTCLDHIYSDNPVIENHVYHSTITDHFMVWVKFEKRLFFPPGRIIVSRNLKKLATYPILGKFRSHIESNLHSVNWECIEINDGVDLLQTTILAALDHFAPERPVTEKHKSWVDNSIKRLIWQRDKLYKEVCRSPDDEILKQRFRDLRNRTKLIIRKRKHDFIQEKFNIIGTDSKAFHSHLNGVLGKRNEQTMPLLSREKSLDDFYNYFAAVGLNNQKTIDVSKMSFPLSPSVQSMFLLPVNCLELCNIIQKLKNKNSFGPDGISNKVLKLCCNSIIEPLQILINRCMREGSFPKSLKIAKVVPIYKDGDKNKFDNYRPISMLSGLAKIFERVIYNRTVSFLHTFCLFNENQFGFRPKRQTIDALASVIESIISSISIKENVCCIFLDLKKAFDTIDHRLLLEKLYNLGFRGPVNKLIHSYLNDRFQYMQFNTNWK